MDIGPANIFKLESIDTTRESLGSMLVASMTQCVWSVDELDVSSQSLQIEHIHPSPLHLPQCTPAMNLFRPCEKSSLFAGRCLRDIDQLTCTPALSEAGLLRG